MDWLGQVCHPGMEPDGHSGDVARVDDQSIVSVVDGFDPGRLHPSLYQFEPLFLECFAWFLPSRPGPGSPDLVERKCLLADVMNRDPVMMRRQCVACAIPAARRLRNDPARKGIATLVLHPIDQFLQGLAGSLDGMSAVIFKVEVFDSRLRQQLTGGASEEDICESWPAILTGRVGGLGIVDSVSNEQGRAMHVLPSCRSPGTGI